MHTIQLAIQSFCVHWLLWECVGGACGRGLHEDLGLDHLSNESVDSFHRNLGTVCVSMCVVGMEPEVQCGQHSLSTAR